MEGDARRKTESAGFQFREVGAKAGIKGVTVCGRTAKSAVAEANGSGVCWLDYNNDGVLDLYVVNGSTLEYLSPDPSAPKAAIPQLSLPEQWRRYCRT